MRGVQGDAHRRVIDRRQQVQHVVWRAGTPSHQVLQPDPEPSLPRRIPQPPECLHIEGLHAIPFRARRGRLMSSRMDDHTAHAQLRRDLDMTVQTFDVLLPPFRVLCGDVCLQQRMRLRHA